MTKRKLVKLVEDRLKKVGHNIDFDVIDDGVRQQESWWLVPVLATRNGKDIPREIAINIFSNVEDEIEQNDHVTIMFLPAIVEEVPSRWRNGR